MVPIVCRTCDVIDQPHTTEINQYVSRASISSFQVSYASGTTVAVLTSISKDLNS